ncbi:hypothetical protein [Thermococcus sp.]
MLFFLAVAGTLLLIFEFNELKKALSRRRSLIVIFIFIIGVLIVHPIRNSSVSLLGVETHWNDNLSLCGGRVYHLRANAGMVSILLRAVSSAEYADIRRKMAGRVFDPGTSKEGDERASQEFPRETTLLYMHSVPPYTMKPEKEAEIIREVKSDLIKRGVSREAVKDMTDAVWKRYKK